MIARHDRINPVTRIALGVILAGYLAAGSLYALYTPAWQAPDEPAHYNYVRQLAAGEWPVLERGDYDQAYQAAAVSSGFDPAYSVAGFEYEDYQPPLYYLLLTPVYVIFGGELVALRLASVLLGAGVVVLAYGVGRRVFPGRPWLAATAAAFVAFLPQHVAIMAAVNNDTLAEVWIGAIVVTLLEIRDWRLGIGDGLSAASYQPSAVSPRKWLILGTLLGLGFLTKATVYVMAPVVGLVLLRRYWGDWRGLARAAVWVYGPAVLLGALWWGRNAVVYGGVDVMGIEAHNAVVVGQPRTAEWIASKGWAETAWALARTTFQSFWGQFGWMAVVMPKWVYGALGAFTLLVAGGWWLGAVSSKQRAGGRRQSEQKAVNRLGGRIGQMAVGRRWSAVLVLGSVVVFTAGLYLAYNVTFVQHQGRYLFPALIPIAVSVAAGVEGVTRPFTRRWSWLGWVLAAGVGLGLWGLALLALFWFVIPSLG